MKARYFLPLLGFAVPSLLIGFGFVIPGSCIEGVNNLTVGFASTVVGAAVTYWLGIRAVLADHDRPPEPRTELRLGRSE
jgi:ABC-type Fe3+ transport system permease subunit